MVQSCASAAKLRGGGPILTRGSKTICKVGLPPPRSVICSRPAGASPVVTSRQSAMRSFDEEQADHVAPQLGQRVRRYGSAFRRAQCLQSLRHLSKRRPKAANAETGEISPHSVHNARALIDQALALTARPSCVLVLERRNCSHTAAFRLAAQPAEKGARLSSSVSRRSVFAHRCSRETGTLDGWIT
jgi:hypothetical protein